MDQTIKAKVEKVLRDGVGDGIPDSTIEKLAAIIVEAATETGAASIDTLRATVYGFPATDDD